MISFIKTLIATCSKASYDEVDLLIKPMGAKVRITNKGDVVMEKCIIYSMWKERSEDKSNKDSTRIH